MGGGGGRSKNGALRYPRLRGRDEVEEAAKVAEELQVRNREENMNVCPESQMKKILQEKITVQCYC